MTFHTWLAFVSVSILLVIVPGPTVLMIIGDTLANRKQQSWSPVLGVCLADLTAMTLSLAGAGVLLQASSQAFTVLKICGGGYLVYLGIRSILRARKVTEEIPYDVEIKQSSQTTLARFSKAYAITALNPKSILFFVAFVPQFISAKESFLIQSTILLATFVAIGTLNVAVYASLAGWVSRYLNTVRAQRIINYAGGGALLTAGALTLALKQK